MLSVAAVLIWSVNIVVTRYAVDFIAPMSISFYRWLIAWCILTPFLLPTIWRNRQMVRPLLGQLAILALFGMVCYQGIAYSAAQYTTATNMGIINAFTPVVSIFLSVLLLNIRPTKIAVLGTFISIFGLAYLITQGNFAQLLNADHILGDVLMLLAVSLYAFYGVFLQRWKIQLPLLQMLYVQISFAVLFHLPILMVTGLDPLTTNSISSVVYAAIFPSLFAPVLWMLSIQKLGSNRTSIFMNLLPIFTALIAFFVLKETWTTYHTLGGILVLVGLMMAQRK